MKALLSNERLLVVEDEALVLMMIEDMLADLGCSSVTTAASVENALALIDVNVFDAAMLDMNLNGSDSRPVADALISRDVPFVYCTGNASLDMKDGYPERPVLRKPFQYQQLAAILTGLLSL
jgi:CheY-like chemotaxis protein